VAPAASSTTSPSLLVVPELGGLDAASWTQVATAASAAATRLDILTLLDPSQQLLAPVAGLSPRQQKVDPVATQQVVAALTGQADALRAALDSPQHAVLYAGPLVSADGGQMVPTAAVMAGVIATSDSREGIWNAPAGAAYPLDGWTPQLVVDNDQQGGLNVAGVNAARVFPTMGTLMWGARTLSKDAELQYVPVARTFWWIQRSLQAMVDQAVFAPNTSSTWAALAEGADTFLQGVWSQGGLTGTTATDAYSVTMGLGSTMSAQDILDGYMRMEVQVDMVHPAQYLEMDLTARTSA